MASVHRLTDLESWGHAGTSLAVLGHPVSHSLSPTMHNAALRELSKTNAGFATWKYFRLDVPPDELTRALDLLHERGFRGLNLTVPHKVLAFGAVAEIDRTAKQVGAVNTLAWTERGWRGFNTDGYGLREGIRESLGIGLAGQHVILLGAGGAARGAAVECLGRGCASLTVANRTRENLDALLRTLGPLAGSIPIRGFAPSEPPGDLRAGSLVINATSAGLKPGDPVPIDLAGIPAPAAVYDLIYNPAVTPLLARAMKMGIPAANGLAMLVYQGAKSLEIWTGVPAGKTAPVMRGALS